MATIKSYTDINQSKVLATILPLESADYTRLGKDEDNVLTRSYFESCSSELKDWVDKDEIYPCWSIASLLSVLPEPYQMTSNKEGKVQLMVIHHLEKDYYDNPVDACYEMILKLHELKML